MANTINQVEQNADGIVFVRDATTGKVYSDTVANFNADFTVTMPALPTGADHRIYTPNVRHALASSVTIIADGGIPWALGDSVIANINTGLSKQAARQPAPPHHPP
jgi:hypothetical protein